DGDLLSPASGKIAAVVQHEPGRRIGRRIEGNGDFQARPRSEHRDLLREGKLRGTGEGKLPAFGKRQQPARQPVRAEGGIPLHQRNRPQRLGAVQEASGLDGVAADVEQAAYADIRLVAYVSRIVQIVGEY